MTPSEPRVVTVGPLRPGPLGDAVLEHAASGRAGLAALLGDDGQRHALFRPGMRADRFLVARAGDELAGWLSLKYAGAGPFAPRLADFTRCHGVARGLHAFAVFSAIEARSGPAHRAAYIYGIDVLKPFRGRRHVMPRPVGEALIEAAMQQAAALGFAWLDMEVRTAAARALALRMGAMPSAPSGLARIWRGDYIRLTIDLAARDE